MPVEQRIFRRARSWQKFFLINAGHENECNQSRCELSRLLLPPNCSPVCPSPFSRAATLAEESEKS
jgi:Bacterial-like globin